MHLLQHFNVVFLPVKYAAQSDSCLLKQAAINRKWK